MPSDENYQKGWTVYILRCRDGSLYTGIAKDLARRLEQHNTGKGARYTQGRGPCVLVYAQGDHSESSAKKEEYRIKRLSRGEKEGML